MNNWKIRELLSCIVVLGLVTLVAQAQDDTSLFTADSNGANVNTPPRRPLSDDDITDDELLKLKQRELLMDFDADTSLDQGKTIHPKLMDSVKDNTMGIRFEEREAYLRVLRLAQEVPLRRQQKIATELREERRESNPDYRRRNVDDFPQFIDLFTHSDVYRGRPVTIHGTMRKLTKFDLGKNSMELDQAYEGWVYTSESQGNPAVVVFTSKDERLPVGGDIQEEVRFTGYYFKMYGYDAHDTTRKAPLLIAGEVECVPHPYRNTYPPLNTGWYVVTTLAFLLGCYVVWQVNRREMPPRPFSLVEPDFRHFPPLEHPASDPFLSRTIPETEDS